MRIFLCLLFLFTVGYADEKPEAHDKIVDYVFEQFDNVGVIRQDGSGMVYVDIPDDYIHKLHPFLVEEGFQLPTSLDGPRALGAHISVIYGGEAHKSNIGWILERNTKVFFQVTGCKIVPLNQEGYESACVLTIHAPNLNQLRKKYGLPEMKHEFHITIGMKPRKAA